MRVMLEHAKLFEQEFTGIKNFEVMKKHFKAYVAGFDGAKELRMKLMEAENYGETENIVLEHYPVLKNLEIML
jgi:tRNA-dihydrouridine synthase